MLRQGVHFHQLFPHNAKTKSMSDMVKTVNSLTLTPFVEESGKQIRYELWEIMTFDASIHWHVLVLV